ncbi:MAG: M48 family metallopeptidase [Agarilytica sp.]
MNFFQHQDAARKKTGLLVGLLLAAVLTLIGITILAIGMFMYFAQTYSNSVSAYNVRGTSLHEHFLSLLGSPITSWIALGVIAVVALGCLYKWLQLGRGGKAVAEALGGKPINPNSSDPLERKALNIVEEMAIASGNPVPPVYLINDDAINAFAAGLDRRDAVIGLTHGCIKLLSRDELQGVVAHEFSHIHNGDMRLNMRLIAILHGILLIGLIGYFIAHGSGGSYRYHNHRRRDGKQMSLGLSLMAIGYGGTFFGNIIKAAVSRQREFLADASAVQFTRNPSGISGALKKIGGFSGGSQLSSGNAAEFSHLFFGQGVRTAFSSLMATHPPLQDRIKRIEPRWAGKFPDVIDEAVIDNPRSGADAEVSKFSQRASHSTSVNNIKENIVDQVGEAGFESISRADQLIEGLTKELYEAAHEAFSARALVYGLLLDNTVVTRDAQLSQLKREAHPVTYRVLLKMLEDLVALPRDSRLTLLSLCMPALKQLSCRQYLVFKKNLAELVKADKKVSLFEWSIYRITTKTIEGSAQSGKKRLTQLSEEVQNILYFTALAGKNKDTLKAFNQGLAALNMPLHIELPNMRLSLPTLDKSLNRLESTSPLEKPQLLKALIKIINADEKVTDDEKEIFRAVADTLNCPVPPLD